MAGKVIVNTLRDQLRAMLHVESRETGFHAVMVVDAALSVFPDHFPTRPILPGMCMVQAVLTAAAMREGCVDMRLRLLKNAKMMLPIVPGDRVSIDATMVKNEQGDWVVKARLSSGEKALADISLTAGPEHHQ